MTPAGMPGRMGSVEYLYPGTIVFVVLLSAIVGTFSLIQDRHEGFLQALSDHMISLKREYPDHEAASVLLEPHIPYDYLIQVMDVVRSVRLPSARQEELELYSLFAQISVGDAP